MCEEQWRGGAVARWRGGAVARWRGGAVARWLEHRNLNQETSDSVLSNREHV